MTFFIPFFSSDKFRVYLYGKYIIIINELKNKERKINMDRIFVDKDLLLKTITGIKGEGRLELCIIPQQSDCGKVNPAFLHVGFQHDDGTYEDLESIDTSSYKREFVIMESA